MRASERVGEMQSPVPESRSPYALVGRADELRLVADLLARRKTTTVLYIVAPTGMGKTALLEAIAERAVDADRPMVRISCTQLPPTHDQIERALEEAGVDDGPAPVILLDDFETHARLERWYRTKLVPMLPAGTLLVFAGRHRLEQAWHELKPPLQFHRCELPPLDSAVRRRYAAALGVTAERAEHVMQETRGVPLLMRHAMEIETKARQATGDLDARESALHALFIRMLRDVPTEDHRRALWALSLPRRLSPRLLAASLDSAGTREYYRWLSRRAYVTTHDDGLSIASPFRQAVLDDLLRSAPAFHRTVIWRAGQHLMAQFGSQTSFDGRQAVVGELLYMQRRPDIGSHVPQPGGGSGPMRHAHVASARQLITESADSPREGAAAVARLLRTPTEFSVTCDGRGSVTGVIHMSPMPLKPPDDDDDDDDDGADRPSDPDMMAALAAVGRSAAREPPGRRRRRRGPRAIACTVWLPRGANEDSANLAAAYRVLVTCTLSTPDLRVIALRADPRSALGLLVQRAGLMRLAPVEPDTPPLLFRDNECEPPLRWLHGQLVAAVSQDEAAGADVSGHESMSRDDFSYSVRDALHRIGDASALTDNPLAAVAVAGSNRDHEGSGVRHLIKRGLDVLSASAHSRRDADRLRRHYGIEDALASDGGEARHETERGGAHSTPRDLEVAEDRLIAALWQEHVQRMRAGSPR